MFGNSRAQLLRPIRAGEVIKATDARISWLCGIPERTFVRRDVAFRVIISLLRFRPLAENEPKRV